MSDVEKQAEFSITVSVLTPAHNARDVLARAVTSVQAQSVTDWEMIIVDDGSSDGTGDVARGLAAQDPRVRVLDHAVGQGAAGARNTGLAAAQGRYIAFLDADDAWHPDKLARQLDLMQAHNAGLSYTGFARVSQTGRRAVQVPARITRSGLLRGNAIGCSTALYDRALLGSVLMPDLRLRQDYALWLTILARTPFAVGVMAPLVDIHVTQGSLSSNKWRAMRATWRMHHDHFGTGALRSAFYVVSHTLRRLRRG